MKSGIVTGIRLPRFPENLAVEIEWVFAPLPSRISEPFTGGRVEISYREFSRSKVTLGDLIEIEEDGSVRVVEGRWRSATAKVISV